jgi:uncharacterized BrkB/YihY/UPF0761 family membrane protein
MNALFQSFKKPVVMALFVLVCCLYVFNSTATRFLSDMRKDRDDMVVSLRQAQTPEPQVTAISKAFDRIISNVNSMVGSYFMFTSVVLVAAFAVRYREPSHQNTQHQGQEELKHDRVV